MEVRNCRGCGRLYNYIGSVTPMCPNCMKSLDEKYESVKQYIYDNPRANINQVSMELEVSIQQLQRWIREERLSFSDDSAVGIECENCGTMIKTGRFCLECKAKLKNEINSVIPKKTAADERSQKDGGPRMRYLDQ